MPPADLRLAEAARRPLIYFHGFNSAIPANLADSPKITALEEYARRSGRAFLPQNIDYRQVQAHSREVLSRVGEDAGQVLFCGASMGGWLARIMQLLLLEERPGLPVECVVFNPAFDLAQFSHMLEGPQVNHVTLEEYCWTPEHGAALVKLEQSVDYRAVGLPYRVYVDADDELIHAGWSEDFHRGFSRFKAYPGGDHSFQHSREALEDYDNGCWQRPLQ